MKNRRFIHLLFALLLVITTLTGCGTSNNVSKNDENSIRDCLVGISWREDDDSEFYTNITATLDDLGVSYVMLEEVVTEDLPYESDNVSGECIDKNDILKQEYADVIKENAYKNSNVQKVMKGIDAVIFTGGEDISPTLLRTPEEWHGIEKERDYNATRDVNDYILMSYCLDNDIPLMGFCRGMQMLGTVSGASFIQDIPQYFTDKGVDYNYLHRNNISGDGSYRDYSPHDVSITDKDSILYQIVGSDVLRAVPSWHHQAIRSVKGTKLKVTGVTDTNGIDIIESIQRTDKKFAAGFQFHPEAAVVKSINKADNASEFMNKQMAEKFFSALVNAING